MNSQIRYIEMAIPRTTSFAGRFVNRKSEQLHACDKVCTNGAYCPIRIKLVLENGMSENSNIKEEIQYGQEV
jgi:hypothetical protein